MKPYIPAKEPHLVELESSLRTVQPCAFATTHLHRVPPGSQWSLHPAAILVCFPVFMPEPSSSFSCSTSSFPQITLCRALPLEPCALCPWHLSAKPSTDGSVSPAGSPREGRAACSCLHPSCLIFWLSTSQTWRLLRISWNILKNKAL